jgi:hypothetical protein
MTGSLIVDDMSSVGFEKIQVMENEYKWNFSSGKIKSSNRPEYSTTNIFRDDTGCRLPSFEESRRDSHLVEGCSKISLLK